MISLALCFLYIGAFSFGGGLSAVSLIQTEIVERLGWLTDAVLLDIMAIAEMTPGPMAVNAASFAGMRLHGMPGAVLATCACVLPGCVVSFLVSRANARLQRNTRWQYALNLLRAAVTGIILNGGLTILSNVLRPGGNGMDLIALGCFAAGLAAYRHWKIPPMPFMLAMGAVCGLLRLMQNRLVF